MANLPFEYHPRYKDLASGLASQNADDLAHAAQQMEDRDRSLEDFLAKPHSTVSAGALIAIDINSSGYIMGGGSICSTSVTVPSDGGNYYIETIGTLFALIDNPHDGTVQYVHDIEPRIVASQGSGWAGGAVIHDQPSFDWAVPTLSGSAFSDLGGPMGVVQMASNDPSTGVQGFELFCGYNAAFSTATSFQVGGSIITRLFSLPV